MCENKVREREGDDKEPSERRGGLMGVVGRSSGEVETGLSDGREGAATIVSSSVCACV